jgi:apolipoprotein N-acyltransferase
VIPGSEKFFGTGGNLLQTLLIWVALLALSSAPWIALYNREFLPVSAVVGIIVLSLPPFSLVTVAHPLIAVGEWLPGTRWWGLCLPLILILACRRLGTVFTLAVLLGASLATHARFHRPLQDPRIVAVNTRFGGAATRDIFGSKLQGQETAMQKIALMHPDTLVLFPESIIPTWTPAHDERWATTFAQLQARHTGLLIGTTIPVANTEANRNVLLSRGYTERLSYVQRVPVPLGMWRFGDERNGFPLMLRYPATIRIWDRRAGVLICYEQLLVWPALQTLSRNPDMLLAPSNLYWASGTIIPSVQHVSAQDWADLWAIPLYEASNR